MKASYCKVCVWGVIAFAVANSIAFRYLSRVHDVIGTPIAIFDSVITLPDEFTLYARTSASIKSGEITFVAKNMKLVVGHDTHNNQNLLSYLETHKKEAEEHCGVNVVSPSGAGEMDVIYTADDFMLLIDGDKDVLMSIIGQLCNKS